MSNILMAVFGAVLSLIVSIWGGLVLTFGGGDFGFINGPFGCHPEWVGSFDGSVPQDSAAYSPNRKYYCKEIEPYSEGNFGVFDRKDDQLVWSWHLDLTANAPKGIAWSPDSKRVALMYHWSSGSGGAYGTGDPRNEIYAYELFKEQRLAQATIEGWYRHAMCYADDGQGVLLPETVTIHLLFRDLTFERLSDYVALEEIDYGQ